MDPPGKMVLGFVNCDDFHDSTLAKALNLVHKGPEVHPDSPLEGDGLGVERTRSPMHSQVAHNSQRKQGAALLSIVSNSTLVVGKLFIGLLCGSVAVVSEAVHSASDLMASIIAYAAVRMSDSPPDEDHPYGHGKIESISSLAEALLIFAWPSTSSTRPCTSC